MLRRSELIFSRVYSSELSRSFAGENKVVKMLKSTQNKMYMKHFSQDNVHCIGHICFVNAESSRHTLGKRGISIRVQYDSIQPIFVGIASATSFSNIT